MIIIAVQTTTSVCIYPALGVYPQLRFIGKRIWGCGERESENVTHESATSRYQYITSPHVSLLTAYSATWFNLPSSALCNLCFGCAQGARYQRPDAKKEIQSDKSKDFWEQSNVRAVLYILVRVMLLVEGFLDSRRHTHVSDSRCLVCTLALWIAVTCTWTCRRRRSSGASSGSRSSSRSVSRASRWPLVRRLPRRSTRSPQCATSRTATRAPTWRWAPPSLSTRRTRPTPALPRTRTLTSLSCVLLITHR